MDIGSGKCVGNISLKEIDIEPLGVINVQEILMIMPGKNRNFIKNINYKIIKELTRNYKTMH